MRAIQKLSRRIGSALFTLTLGDTFDWVQSVPAGEPPRRSPAASAANGELALTVGEWRQTNDRTTTVV